MPYQLYAGDGVTPVAIPQPNGVTWDRVDRGAFADGTPRTSRKAVVEWRIRGPISAADFQKFSTYRPASGRLNFDTLAGPDGATPAAIAKCTGIMVKHGGTLNDGEYEYVLVRFTEVEQL